MWGGEVGHHGLGLGADRHATAGVSSMTWYIVVQVRVLFC